MYATVLGIVLLFPWSILGVMLVGAVGRRLRRAAVRSR